MVKVNNRILTNYINDTIPVEIAGCSDNLIFNYTPSHLNEVDIKKQKSQKIKQVPMFEFLQYKSDDKIDIEAIIIKNNKLLEDFKSKDCEIIEAENIVLYINNSENIFIENGVFTYENRETGEIFTFQNMNETYYISKKTSEKTEEVTINADGHIIMSRIISSEDYIENVYDEQGQILINSNLKKHTSKSFLNGKEFKVIEKDMTTYPYIKNLQHALQNHKIIDFKDFVSDLKKLSPELNVDDFLKLYKEQSGSFLINDIANCESLSNKEKDNLYNILEPDFAKMRLYKISLEQENEQIKNKYYTGEIFDIKYAGRYIEVKNKASNEVVTLNLKELLKNIENESEFYQVVRDIQQLPAEVVFDLANEVESIQTEKQKKDENGFQAAGYYTRGTNTIVLDAITDKIIAHELAHALDNLYGKFNTYYVSDCYNNFNIVFKEELEVYLKREDQFDYENPPNIFEQIFKKDNYMTANPQEAFARSYEVLLLGENYKIFKEFPKTLTAAKELLKEIRQAPKDNRKK